MCDLADKKKGGVIDDGTFVWGKTGKTEKLSREQNPLNWNWLGWRIQHSSIWSSSSKSALILSYLKRTLLTSSILPT